MIGYVKGILTEIEDERAIVECAGVGYEVMIPLSVRAALPPIGSEVKLYTYQSVREDALDLFGFLDKDDLAVYRLLINVSGIGPKGGLSILSVLSADELRLAVISQDAKAISRANGIGAKTAQRVILELKDKFHPEDVLGGEQSELSPNSAATNARNEAIEALVSLGYSASDSMRAVSGVKITSDMDSEAILKSALKLLAFM